MALSPSKPAMQTLVEHNGRHTATFQCPAHWEAWKYDDEQDPRNDFYQRQMSRAQAVSAVDFVAHDPASRLLVMVECKDVRGATADNLPRLQKEVGTPADPQAKSAIAQFKNSAKRLGLPLKVARDKPYLPVEFAKNIRDTLVGLLAAHRAGDPALKRMAQHVMAGDRLACVLVFEMDPLSTWMPGEGMRLLGRLQSAIQRELACLQNVDVVICSQLMPDVPLTRAWTITTSPSA